MCITSSEHPKTQPEHVQAILMDALEDAHIHL